MWCEHGLIGKCFPGARSLRIHVPFVADEYEDDAAEAVIDFDKPIKGMPARMSLEDDDDVKVAGEIMAQTVLLKETKVAGKKKKASKKKAPAKGKSDAPAPKPGKKPSKPGKPKKAATPAKGKSKSKKKSKK